MNQEWIQKIIPTRTYRTLPTYIYDQNQIKLLGYLLISSNDTRITILSLGKIKLIRKFTQKNYQIRGVSYDCDRKSIIFGKQNIYSPLSQELIIYYIQTAQQRNLEPIKDYCPYSGLLYMNHEVFLVSIHSYELIKYNILDQTILNQINKNQLNSLFVLDGSKLCILELSGDLGLRDYNRNQQEHIQLQRNLYKFTFILFNEKFLIYSIGESQIGVYDLECKKSVSKFLAYNYGSIKISNITSLLIANGSNYKIQRLNPITGENIGRCLILQTFDHNEVNDLEFLPNGRFFMALHQRMITLIRIHNFMLNP